MFREVAMLCFSPRAANALVLEIDTRLRAEPSAHANSFSTSSPYTVTMKIDGDGDQAPTRS